MAAPVDNLIASYNNVCSLIATLTANPNPTTSIDGKTVNKTEYLAELTRQAEALHLAIRREQGPFTIRTRAET